MAEPPMSGAGGGTNPVSQPGAVQLGPTSLGTTSSHTSSGSTSAGTENDEPMEVDCVGSHSTQVPAPVTVVASSIPTT